MGFGPGVGGDGVTTDFHLLELWEGSLQGGKVRRGTQIK